MFREDNKWTQVAEEEDHLDSISENAFDESDFEIKVKPNEPDSASGFDN